LYEVRETFLVQVEVARKKYDALIEEREGRVESELRRRGLLLELNSMLHTSDYLSGTIEDRRSNGNDLENTFDVDPCSDNDRWGGTVLDDDDGWGGTTVHEDDIIGEEIGIGQCQIHVMTRDDDEDENDEWSPLNVNINPLGMNVVVDSLAKGATEKSAKGSDNAKARVDAPRIISKLEPISHDDNLQRKSHRSQKRMKEQTSASAGSTNQRHQYLRREQASLRESLKTSDERIAEATFLKLEERLQNVDDLLERLQEEEWADDEDEDGGLRSNLNAVDTNVEAGEEGASLLDSILAMILGALPKEMNSSGECITTDDGHFRHMKDEHDSIVEEWRNVFGRLPPFPSPEPAPEPKSECLSLDSVKFDGLQLVRDGASDEAAILVDNIYKSGGEERDNWEDWDD
jgi:hypothetical protein